MTSERSGVALPSARGRAGRSVAHALRSVAPSLADTRAEAPTRRPRRLGMLERRESASGTAALRRKAGVRVTPQSLLPSRKAAPRWRRLPRMEGSGLGGGGPATHARRKEERVGHMGTSVRAPRLGSASSRGQRDNHERRLAPDEGGRPWRETSLSPREAQMEVQGTGRRTDLLL